MYTHTIQYTIRHFTALLHNLHADLLGDWLQFSSKKLHCLKKIIVDTVKKVACDCDINLKIKLQQCRTH